MKIFDWLETKGKYLNEVQKQAVLHDGEPLLLLAVPGSGKTTTLNAKIGHLIMDKGYDAKRILPVTFSKASATDMLERFHELFGNTLPAPNYSTIHSFALKIAGEGLSKEGRVFEIIEGEDSEEKVDEETGIKLKKYSILKAIYQEVHGIAPTDDQMEELIRVIGFMKNKCYLSQDAKKVETNIHGLDVLFEKYEAFKSKNENLMLLDFDDMLTHANRILWEHEEIAIKYQQMFDVILTDESQDTSMIQHLIIEKLAEKHQNICVVGDDDQTLYSWRGAEVTKLLRFKDTYPEATILFMEQNYRSSKEIVETSNIFIQRNNARYPKNMFTKNPSGDEIVIEQLDTARHQVKYVIGELKKVENLSETAILYRNNRASLLFMDALDKAKIPYYIKDTDTSFYGHWVVRDILAFFSFAEEPANLTKLSKIYSKFNGYISRKQIDYLQMLGGGTPALATLLKEVDLPDYQVKNLRRLESLFERMPKMTPNEAIKVIRNDMGYEKTLLRISERLGFNSSVLFEVLDSLESLVDTVGTIQEVEAYLFNMEGQAKKSKFNKNKNAVTLSTFHSSKGLEFERVYMVNLHHLVIPNKEAVKAYREGKPEEMEEAVRLFYVGMTRAKKHLELLSYRKKGKDILSESIFVRDVRKILQPEVLTEKKAKSIKEKPVTAPLLGVAPLSKVKHKKFGEGVVESIVDGTLVIQFENGGRKELSHSFCSQHNLLNLVLN